MIFNEEHNRIIEIIKKEFKSDVVKVSSKINDQLLYDFHVMYENEKIVTLSIMNECYEKNTFFQIEHEISITCIPLMYLNGVNRVILFPDLYVKTEIQKDLDNQA